MECDAPVHAVPAAFACGFFLSSLYLADVMWVLLCFFLEGLEDVGRWTTVRPIDET